MSLRERARLWDFLLGRYGTYAWLVQRRKRPFWAWEVVDGPVYWIYYRGFWSWVWNEFEGWSFGGLNVD